MPSAEEAGQMLLERFGQITYQFLDASCEVWDDKILHKMREDFDAANVSPSLAKTFTQNLQKEFVKEFHKLFTRIEARDETILLESDFLMRIDAKAKYDAASEEVRGTCWEYAKQVVQSATMGDVYEKCPSQMVQKVASMADRIVKDMQGGSLDFSKLNPMELSKEMMEGIDPKALEEWGNSLKSSGNMEHITKMMLGMLGKDSPLGQMMQDPALSSMASMMQNPALSSMLQNPALTSMLQNPAALTSMLQNPALSSMLQNPALAMMQSFSMD